MSDVPDARARRIRFAIIVVAAVLVFVGGPIGAFLYLTYIPDTSQPRTITDAHKIVTIDLPAGWFEDTRKDAGEISTRGDSGDETEPYRVPDIEASRNLLDSATDDLDSEANDLCAFDVTIGIPDRGTSHEVQHKEQVTATKDGYKAISQAETTGTTISGHPALSTTIRFPDLPYVVLVTTVVTDNYLITMNGYTDLSNDPRGEDLQRLMTNARIV